MLEPESAGIAHMIHGLPQAERAGTRAAVGQVDIQTVVYIVHNRHFFFHRESP